MAKVAPSFQTRSQQPRDWGNYASLAVLPNAAGWLGGSAASFPLEQGDTAFVIGTGPVYCDSAGTPGGLDAVWASTQTIVNLDGGSPTSGPPAWSFDGGSP